MTNVRVTFRRRHSYRTNGNKVQATKTPGGRLVAHYIKKSAKGPKCGDTGVRLPGIAAMRPAAMKNAKRREKTVSRAYGGTLCGGAVRERIVRAFLIEEQKIVKKVLLEKMKKKTA